jgi:NADPH2:quinone reductase
MRAIHVSRLDGPESVELVDLPEPEPAPDQVLIEVHAAGVSFPDLLLSRGLYQYKPALPFVPGAEAAGVVLSAPPGSGFTPGDRVVTFALVGTWVERIAAPPERVFRIPDNVGFVGGAGLLMNYLTVHFGLVRRGQIQKGETVLVHGATGGVGVATLQLAPALGASRVIAVVSDQRKADFALTAGATDVVLADGWLDAVRTLTDGRGVDLVLDPVGGDRFTDSVRSLAGEGRLLVVGFAAGSIPTVAVNRLLLKNVAVVGVAWGEFVLGHPAYLVEQWQALEPLLADGLVRPVEGPAYPLERAADALLALDRREATGKVVLTLR